jgi:outer membrane protein OmpA-like peptidoglycan-associated protein
MPAKPMIDGVDLQQVTRIEGDLDHILRPHRVPALEGDFFQPLNRRAIRIRLRGVLTGSQAGKSLEGLRGKFRSAQPVTFVSDIATATQTARVLIQEMKVREFAGKPERFEYVFGLVEYIGPSGAKATAPAQPSVPSPGVAVGQLAVEITTNSALSFNPKAFSVTIEGTQEQGQSFSRSLYNRSGLTWSEDSFPPGRYSVIAVGTDPPMSGISDVVVRAGQISRITLNLNETPAIVRKFVVHFDCDKAFIQPAMRPVLEQVSEYARSHSGEKLTIVGHTDLGGDPAGNQLLSERRARSVYHYLVQAKGKSAQEDWESLRQSDRWGVRQQEAMLLDLGYLTRETEGDPGSLRVAIRAFQRDHGLEMSGQSRKETWAALIEAYMCRASIAVRDTQILNVDDPAQPGGRKWEGRGSDEPVRNKPDAWRPNRRTELIFVKARDLQAGEWFLQPAETGTFVVRGSVHLASGAPLRNAKYVLTAPDGEYMDGERSRGPRYGEPIPGKTASDGTFAYPDNAKGPGIYSIELLGPFHARVAGQRPESVCGRSVWKRLDGATEFCVLAEPAPTASRQRNYSAETALC